ncbi:MAG: polysaccharide deacetylase family protein [Sphingobium sp.]
MTHPDSLLHPPEPHQFIAWDKALGRRFMLFVDTEEEFDWNAPFDRAATRVSAIRGFAEGQAYFAAAGIRPVYLSDYPILRSDRAVALLGQWLADGTADVGAHLHPWVTPPHEEEVCAHNSFAGNLAPELERAKLFAQCAYMEERLGRRPIAYRAGRYGIGDATGRALLDAGFRLDCSVRSRFDYRVGHGPDFSGLPLKPYRAGPGHQLIELPLSTAFTGHLRGFGERMHGIVRRSGKLGGALSRAGLFARVPLTPEGVPARQCVAAIDALIEEDVPVLSFSFHSPTLEPGNTAYVRDADDLAAFYRWWDIVLDHLDRRSVTPIGLDALMTALMHPTNAEHSCQAA